MRNVVFVTGNPNKAQQFSQLIGLDIDHQPVELDEIQTLDSHELVDHKVRQAYAAIKKPVLVEDVSLTFTEWGNLPGPFVKFFINAPNGLEMMCRMLDGFATRHASVSCVFGYFDGHVARFSEGSLEGEITAHPRGSGGYGFDSIFIPNGFAGKTAAELMAEEYAKYYTTIKPFATLREFLTSESSQS